MLIFGHNRVPFLFFFLVDLLFSFLCVFPSAIRHFPFPPLPFAICHLPFPTYPPAPLLRQSATSPLHSPSFLRINQNPIMHQHNQIILPVSRHVRHRRLARLGQIASSAAKCSLFKNLPPICRNQFVL